MSGLRRAGRSRASGAILVVLGLFLAGCGSGGEDSAGTAADATGGAPAPDATAPPTTVAPPPTTSAACPEPGVRATLGVEDGAMGLRLTGIRLTNCGTQPYTVSGYPVVALLDEERRPFDVEVVHGAEPITTNDGFCTPTGVFDTGPQPVTIEPGGHAISAIVWRNLTTDEFDLLVNAPYLSVAPTEADPAQVLVPSGPIDLGTTGRIGVSAWAPSGPSACA